MRVLHPAVGAMTVVCINGSQQAGTHGVVVKHLATARGGAGSVSETLTAIK